MYGLEAKSFATDSTKLVLLDFHGGLSLLKPGDATSRDQLQETAIIKLRRPTDGQLQALSRKQNLICSEEHTRAADVHGLARAFLVRIALAKDAIPDFTLNRKTVGPAPLSCVRIPRYGHLFKHEHQVNPPDIGCT